MSREKVVLSNFAGYGYIDQHGKVVEFDSMKDKDASEKVKLSIKFELNHKKQDTKFCVYYFEELDLLVKAKEVETNGVQPDTETLRPIEPDVFNNILNSNSFTVC